jgi:hypothetical protein
VANDPTPEKFTVTKPWRKPRPSKDNKLIIVVLSNIKRITVFLHSGLLGFWTLSIVRHSKNTEEHNVSELDLFPSSDEGTGDTYSVGPLRKS